MVTRVGEGLCRPAGVEARVFKSIEDIQPRMVLQGSSPHMMNLVLAGSQAAGVIARLHEVFFQDPDPEVFE